VKKELDPHLKTALICGVSGQDGSYLAELLLKKGYKVYGSSRDAQVASFDNLTRLGLRNRIEVVSISPTDFRSVLQVLAKVGPDEIYNLAGQSSVGLSFEQPVETLESIGVGTLNLLEAIRFLERPIRFYNACSSECFGDTGGEPADERTPFRPRSPYGVAKATAYWEVANYREAYGLFACSGLLFNHESPLRALRFVTKKIISAACRIAGGAKERLNLGNLEIERDWGWAPEYVEAMWLMMQRDKPEDYVIATGESRKLHEFVHFAFECVGLNWAEYVIQDDRLARPTELLTSRANPKKANISLGWKAKYKMREVITFLLESERKGQC
jgi:GDPmannose 4,6-dehydratase